MSEVVTVDNTAVFAGAARELTNALLVNPYDTDGVKATLMRALDMSRSEARRRMKGLRRQVLRNDVVIGTTQGPAVETPEGVGLEVNHGPLGSPPRRRGSDRYG